MLVNRLEDTYFNNRAKYKAQTRYSSFDCLQQLADSRKYAWHKTTTKTLLQSVDINQIKRIWS